MDSMEESSSENRGSVRRSLHPQLNLPPGMSRNTLCISTPGARAGGQMVSTPSPSRSQYSDRFIPSRSGSNLKGFALLDKSSPSPSAAGKSGDGREDGSAEAYSSLLRTELFGPNAGTLSPATPEKAAGYGCRDSKNSPMSPNRNIFRFKAGGGSNSRPESPYALSPVGTDGDLCGAVCSPPKVPRKIAKSPYKVCQMFSSLLSTLFSVFCY